MLVNCPSCNKHLNVPDTAAGKKARCPGCNNVFDVPTPAAIAVTPVVPKAAPPRQRDANVQEDRPRRRSRAEDDDDDLDDDRTCAKGRRREDDDDDFENEEDERPLRRRAGSGSVAQMAGTVSNLLKIASYVLIGSFVIGLINSYFTASAVRNVLPGNINVRNGPNNINVNLGAFAPSPVSAMLFYFLGAGLVYGICLAFMFIGAAKATQLTGRGLVLTGLIVATVLGSLMAVGAIWGLVVIMGGMLVFTQPIAVLVGGGTSAMLLIAGIRGLSIMGNPAVKAAFAANTGGRPGRRRARDDRYDDDEDDEEDREPRRRRRPRNDDED
jgi:hypothetical protein